MEAADETSEYSPGLFLVDARAGVLPDPAMPDLLILNQPIASFADFARLWSHTRYRICVDGGANRLYDMFNGALELSRTNFLPNAIHGDLDSLRDDVRAFYASHGVDISQDRDQETNDVGKAMNKLQAVRSPSAPKDVFVLGTLGGRVDHGLGFLHEMLREETRDPSLRLWLFSEASVSFILRSRRSVIKGVKDSRIFTENVGIIPIYGPAMITLSGFEWDVKDWDTRMGYRVSTSNHVVADELTVETNVPVLFTIEKAPLPSEHD